MSSPHGIRVLGIDPGLRATGYGVIESSNRKARCITFGAIQTDAQTPLHERLGVIHAEVSAVIETYHPDCIALEKLIYAKNASIALLLGQARGAVLVAAARHSLPMHEYNPTEMKSAVVGRGRASKDQVQKMVQMLLSLNEPPTPDHAADALAAALTYVHSKPTHDLLQRQRK